MSDNDKGGFFAIPMGGFPGFDPEELAKKQAELHAKYAQFGEWLSNATEEDVSLIKDILFDCLKNTEFVGPQIIGMLTHTLYLRFGNCLGCGDNHFDTKDLIKDDKAPE